MRRASRNAACGIIVALLLTGAAQAQPAPFTDEQAREIVARAGGLAKAGRHPAARDTLEQGHRRASAAGAREWEAEFAFRLGRMAHERSLERTGHPERRTLLHRARDWYTRALAARPGSGGALNNLAEVHRALGSTAEAERYYRQAIEVDDGSRTLSLESLSAWLMERGEWEQAAPLYEQLALELPQTGKYHRRLMEQFRRDPGGLTAYMWRLAESGQVRRAQEAALDGLASDRTTEEQKKELLTIFVAALGKERFDPQEFVKTDRGRRLHGLRGHPLVGEGVSEVELLLAGGSWNPSDYGWWREGEMHSDPRQGLWPRDSFRRLARQLAGWWKRAGQPREKAEACLELSMTLVPNELDPGSIGDLADLYIELDDPVSLKRLLGQHEIAIFELKGGAYRASYKKEILEYHRALGKIYAHVGDTGPEDSAQTARFQLEHAQRTAASLEAEWPGGGEPRKPLFDAELAGLLSREYQEAGQEDLAAWVRLETAQRYLKAGDEVATRRLVAPWLGKQPPKEADRFPELRTFIIERDRSRVAPRN